MQKQVGSAGVTMNAKQERIKRVSPLLIQNEIFFDFFFEHVICINRHWHQETENRQKIHKGN